MQDKGKRSALTLVEVMISTVLFISILLAIFSIFGTGNMSLAAAEKKLQMQEQASRTLNKIAERLMQTGESSNNFEVQNSLIRYGVPFVNAAGQVQDSNGKLLWGSGVQEDGLNAYQEISLQGNNVVARRFDSGGNQRGDEDFLGGDISNLAFVLNSGIISINITTQKRIWSKQIIRVNLSTQVRPRN